ncbi:Fic family protein [Candidatus Palauibacter sp.]|uniref:Fic family protein n=1 Tax=Candidatus Palauibacter sp. TaxID=3101350 RepID=UPI003AF21A25
MREANRLVLAGLEEHLEEGVVPGEVPTFSVGVARYSGAPREDCRFLLERLCEWLEEDAVWPDLEEHLGSAVAVALLRAILAHLYIAWIHPFGDGNGRTARLTEFLILARAGVPSPATHLLSNHYSLTRADYYRQLDRSSRANGGRGDALGFIVYSLRRFPGRPRGTVPLRGRGAVMAGMGTLRLLEVPTPSSFTRHESAHARSELAPGQRTTREGGGFIPRSRPHDAAVPSRPSLARRGVPKPPAEGFVGSGKGPIPSEPFRTRRFSERCLKNPSPVFRA